MLLFYLQTGVIRFVCYFFAFDKMVWLVCLKKELVQLVRLLTSHDFSVVRLVHLKKKVVRLVCLLISHDFTVVQLVCLKKQSGVVGSQVSYHVYLTLGQGAQAQHRLIPPGPLHQHGPLHALSHSDDLK